MKDDTKERRASWMAMVLSHPECRTLALELARGLRAAGDPHVSVVDVEVATKYLTKCLQNRPLDQLEAMTIDQVAALWAKGAYGAACYRTKPVQGNARPPFRDRRTT